MMLPAAHDTLQAVCLYNDFCFLPTPRRAFASARSRRAAFAFGVCRASALRAQPRVRVRAARRPR